MLDNSFLSFDWFPGRYSLAEFLAHIPLFLGQAPEAGPHQRWALSASSLMSACYFLFSLFSLASALRGKADDLTIFSHYVFISGTLLVVGLDLWYGYFFAQRQLLWLLPFYLLAVSQAAVERGKALLLGLTAFLLFLPAYRQTMSFQTKVGRGLNSLAQEVRSSARADDVFAFQDEELLMGFLYHYDREAFSRAARLTLQQSVVRFELAENPGKPQRVVLLPSQADRRRLWSFQGKTDDLTVIPPLRKR